MSLFFFRRFAPDWALRAPSLPENYKALRAPRLGDIARYPLAQSHGLQDVVTPVHVIRVTCNPISDEV